MDWTLSRSVYHALAAATSDARRHGYPQVTGAHLIAAFLDDPGSLVHRASQAPGLGATIKTALARTVPTINPVTPGSLPIGFADDVRTAVLGAESDIARVSTTGDVVLRLLTDPARTANRQLDAIGVDADHLIASLTALIGRGEQDQTA